MISSSQIRAARALLGISAADLAERSGVTWKTVQRYESADGVPPSRGGNLERVQQALEEAGVEFIGDPETTPGVRLKPRRR